MAITDIWPDTYRPRRLDDYVFEDPEVERQVRSWVSAGATDNLYLVGPPGVGKTSLADVLLTELGVSKADRLWINASRERNIDVVRSTVKSFVDSGGWDGLRYVVLDEADGLTVAAQMALKADIEAAQSTCRFILTANDDRKIVPAIQDRVLRLYVAKPDKDRFLQRLVQVLEAEQVELGEDAVEALDDLVRICYPSLRKGLRELQRCCSSGRLLRPRSIEKTDSSDWRVEALGLFRAGDVRTARTMVCERCPREEIGDVYRWLYDNIDFFADADGAILAIADGLYRHAIVADPEINLSATMVRLAKL